MKYKHCWIDEDENNNKTCSGNTMSGATSNVTALCVRLLQNVEQLFLSVSTQFGEKIGFFPSHCTLLLVIRNIQVVCSMHLFLLCVRSITQRSHQKLLATSSTCFHILTLFYFIILIDFSFLFFYFGYNFLFSYRFDRSNGFSVSNILCEWS